MYSETKKMENISVRINHFDVQHHDKKSSLKIRIQKRRNLLGKKL